MNEKKHESNELAVPSIDTQLDMWVEEKPGSTEYGESVKLMCQSWARFRRAAYLRSCTRRRSGGRAERRRKRGLPRKEERILSCRGDPGRDRRGAFSPSTSAVGNATGRPIFPSKDCSFLLPTETKRKLPFRRTKRHVFRDCTIFRRSQLTISTVVNIVNLCRTILSGFGENFTFKKTKSSVRINNVINNLNAKCRVHLCTITPFWSILFICKFKIIENIRKLTLIFLRECMIPHVFPVRNKYMYCIYQFRKEEKYSWHNLISFNLIRDDLNC